MRNPEDATPAAEPRPSTAEPRPSTSAEFADKFTDFANAAKLTAQKNKARGDAYGEKLAAQRSQVYLQAASMVRFKQPADAAQDMMAKASQLHVRTPPLIGFDESGLQYISARAWQFCAQFINPRLDERVPKWTLN
jgi:hypothetical protein